MSIIYWVGAALIIIIGLLIMFGSPLLPSGISKDTPYDFLLGGFFIIVGNVFWRIICEFIVILFKINASLDSINDSLESEDDDDDED